MLLFIVKVWGFRYVVHAWGCGFDLLGHPVTTHLVMHGSTCTQLEYCLSLLSWGCMWFMLSMRMPRLLA